MTIQNKCVLEEKDPVKRRERLDERAIAAHPSKIRGFLMQTSMFQGLQAASQIT
jgi:3-(3-hydroxy-phenyl)propionate hydroxylase